MDSIKVECLGGSNLEYCMTFNVTNLHNTPAYGFILGALPPGYFYADCGCGGSQINSDEWAFSSLFPVLIPANSTKTFCVKIIASSSVLSPTNICFTGTLEFGNECCTSPKQWCAQLKPCCNACENISFTMDTLEDSCCCYGINFTNGCDSGFFTHIEYEIITGVFTMAGMPMPTDIAFVTLLLLRIFA
ncbi:MAG: hypothetical protein IPK94_00440 [Saprospiraceae bacterium]|nr:hypothetical protein [Saprospiraceae bacterium]